MLNPVWMLLSLVASVVLSRGAELDIQIVYDNTSLDDSLRQDWGFSAFIAFRNARILFDAGTDADLLLANSRKLGIEPASITHAVISHSHADHVNGLYRLGLKNRSMRVYFLDDFPANVFELASAVGIQPLRVKGPIEIAPGIYSTGPVEGEPSEQALIIETAKGLVVLTGCSHPGLDRMVETAEKQRSSDSVRLLMGGFHMHRQKDEEIRATIARLQTLNVRAVAPAHCTGEGAKQLFRQAFGEHYQPAGAGRRIVLE